MKLHEMANSSYPTRATTQQDGWMNEGTDIVAIFLITKLFRMRMWISWRAGREVIKETAYLKCSSPLSPTKQGGLGHT